MTTLDENVKSRSFWHWNTGFGNHSSRSTLLDGIGQMECVRAIVDCGSTSISMTLRLLKHLGISQQAPHITTLSMNGGVVQYGKDTGTKTRITVKYLEYLAPVYLSDVLVVAMRAYNLIRSLPWFHKQNHVINWARLTLSDHRDRVEQRKWPRSLRQWHWRFHKPKMVSLRQASRARSRYTDTWSNLIRRSSS